MAEFKQSKHIFTGLQQDLANDKFKQNEHYIDAHNIRIINDDKGTSLCVTNEKGNSLVDNSNNTFYVHGKYLGHAVLDNYLIVFSTSKTSDSDTSSDDYIYKYDFSTLTETNLYTGNLNFKYSSRIETIPWYENDKTQKVYWVDGYNQLRSININNTYTVNCFEAMIDINKTVNISVEKDTHNGGSFKAGTIQYFITAAGKNGQESAIFKISPINYIAPDDRGAQPNETVNNIFKVTVSIATNNIDYLNTIDYFILYSIQRQSLDTEPIITKVTTFELSNNSTSFTYSDDGSSGEITSSDVLYKTNAVVIPETMAQKDNTLFLGNIKTSNFNLKLTANDALKSGVACSLRQGFSDIGYPESSGTTYYNYNQLNKDLYSITGYKNNEWYRLGVQFKSKTGEWSQPVFIKDIQCDKHAKSDNYGMTIDLPYFSCKLGTIDIPGTFITMNQSFIDEDGHEITNLLRYLKDKNIIAVRPLIVLPNENKRETIAQGIVTPTVFNVGDRIQNDYTGAPFAQPSWFFRPIPLLQNINHELLTVGENVNNTVYHPTILGVNLKSLINDEWDYVWNAEGYDATGINLPSLTLDVLKNGYKMRDVSKENANIKITNGTFLEYKHLSKITGQHNKMGEIEYASSVDSPPVFGWYDTRKSLYDDSEHVNYPSLIYEKYYVSGDSEKTETNKEHLNDYQHLPEDHEFYIDDSIVTLNSPELDFNDQINIPDNIGFRIVGVAPSNSGYGVMTLDADATIYNRRYTHTGFRDSSSSIRLNLTNNYEGRSLASMPLWFDSGNYINSSFSSELKDTTFARILYPWQQTGSLSRPTYSPDKDKANIKSKTIANYRYSEKTIYFDDVNLSVADVKKSMDLVKLKYQDDEIQYYQNIDKLLTPSLNFNTDQIDSDDGCMKHTYYNNYIKKYSSGDLEFFFNYSRNYCKEWSDEYDLNAPYVSFVLNEFNNRYYTPNGSGELKVDALSMIYNTTNHYVISLGIKEISDGLDKSLHYQEILPGFKLNFNGDTVYRNSPTNGIDLESTDNPNYRTYTLEYLGEQKIDGDLIKQYRYPFWKNWSGNDTPSNKFYQQIIDLNNSRYDGLKNTGVYLIGELYRKNDSASNKYGGTRDIDLQQNVWYIAGSEVRIPDTLGVHYITLNWIYGDTYYQRYDCLKTFPKADASSENNIIDICSVMLETRINIDGRYDHNRGITGDALTLINDTNFNLLNDIYTQKDNINKYYILDDRFTLSNFENQITWTLPKVNGALLDNWMSITLLNTLDFDGDKGPITSLNRFNNQVIAFQPKGISLIKYNQNVALNTTNGLPVELANSGTVDGKQYISEHNGTSNKWSIVETNTGLYFADEINRDLYKYSSNGLMPLGMNKGMKSWFIDNLNGINSYYDISHHDVYFNTNTSSLMFNEDFDSFVSFMDYYNNGSFAMFNINNELYSLYNNNFWKHFNGNYNSFYGSTSDSYVSFIDNSNPEFDKIFSNLDLRHDVYEDSTLKSNESFDIIRSWNEYQDTGNVNLVFSKSKPSNLQRLFRQWRIQVPRSSTNRFDRIRNQWSNFMLKHNNIDSTGVNLNRNWKLYDVVVHYCI